MAETIGMLCDKLTIVKLKQYHTTDDKRLESLEKQALLLQKEVNEYINDAINNKIPFEKLTFEANKVYKKEGNEVADVEGNFGEIFYQLADINCKLWHEQEKVYEFEKVADQEKNIVVKQLAKLNLERNKCIDALNNLFAELLKNKTSN
ncbi:hypothetical protein ACFOWM_02355 [Ferruginibacter yonginensis]|uniref:DUF2383 domain-containing protein n=1 Tax=Ferruginibacter yonginensis TaxID=1310416 RepID=A0ABV8QPG5_9BACT